MLIGLRDQSSSQLLCRLHTKEPDREVQELSLATEPGTFIFFNGDKLYHAVSPLAEGEERIVLTMQYVTNPAMGMAHRCFFKYERCRRVFWVVSRVSKAYTVERGRSVNVWSASIRVWSASNPITTTVVLSSPPNRFAVSTSVFLIRTESGASLAMSV